jgi:type IV pilus assembly protein PilM
MSDSIWKKDISFGRKRDEEPPETAESLRAKQLAFQQRLDEAAQALAPTPVPVAEAPAPVPAPDESIWKKEIGFKRKPAEAPADAGAPEGPPVSIWKKEISFRRKPDAAAGREGESIWKKEISLGRRQARSAQVRALADEALRKIEEESAAEPWLAGPELPPAPAPEPQPKAVAATPAAAAKKPSIWKRELGKPKGEKKAKKEKAPKGERKPRTRLRDVKISLPKSAPKARASSGGGHQVKRLVGLKVGASQLAAARVVNNGAAELVQVARQPLDQGVVVGGEVRDPEALALALKQFFARNKLPRKNVRLGIASNRIGVRIFDLVGIDDEKQLENAIRFRAQETLPIPLDEAVLDYHLLGETVDEDGTALQRVLLVVAYRELVDRYVAACRKAGITLAGVDLEAFALLRALAAPRPEDAETDSAVVAVAIGHDRSTFAVSNGRICEFTRVIEWGGATLSVAIARALDLAPSEVEQLKRLVSLESAAVPEGVDPEQYALAVDAVRRQVQAFARELVSSLQFYQHQPGSLGIGEIVITGGTAGLAGLAGELQGMIGVQVRVGDPLARLKVAKKLAVDEEVGSLAIAIGLGIED